MNTNELISSLVSSLAWPVSILLMVYLLRNPLQNLLQNISNFKYNNLELNFFEREVNQISEELNVNTGPYMIGSHDHILFTLTHSDPVDTVIDSFEDLNQELMNTITRLELSSISPRKMHLQDRMRLIADRTNIEPKTLSTINELRNLRNMAKHLPSKNHVSNNGAFNYFLSVKSIIETLKKLELKEIEG